MKKREKRILKKIEKAEGVELEKFKEELAESVRKTKYTTEEKELLKREIVAHIPDKFFEHAFSERGLKRDENSFELSIKNIFVDFTFSKQDNKDEDLRKATAYDLILSLNDEVVKDFEIVFKGKVYNKFEGLSIKKGEIFAVKVYRKFEDGMRADLAVNTFEYGIIKFGKVLKS